MEASGRETVQGDIKGRYRCKRLEVRVVNLSVWMHASNDTTLSMNDLSYLDFLDVMRKILQ